MRLNMVAEGGQRPNRPVTEQVQRRNKQEQAQTHEDQKQKQQPQNMETAQEVQKEKKETDKANWRCRDTDENEDTEDEDGDWVKDNDVKTNTGLWRFSSLTEMDTPVVESKTIFSHGGGAGSAVEFVL